MCGIVGYTGKTPAAPHLFYGLKSLEYRGYDSAGIALINDGKINLYKRAGRVDALKFVLSERGSVGIGHTRWATHGGATEKNAHPHRYRRFAVVHNGIIENYLQLKDEMSEDEFSSETDSEVIAHLFEREYHGDLLCAAKRVYARLCGSFAVALLCVDRPNTLLCMKKNSPLLIGFMGEECFLASDLSAIAADGATVYRLDDGEIALLEGGNVEIYRIDGTKSKKVPIKFDLLEQTDGLNGYAHYMEKEIYEIPQAIDRTICCFPSKKEILSVAQDVKEIHLVGCGTAYHSALAANYFAQKYIQGNTGVFLASEYRYGDQKIDDTTLVIAVSQSGETADTVAAAIRAKEKGAKLIVVTNVVHSTLTTYADLVIETKAGREVAVAATKSYHAQLTALYGIFLTLAEKDCNLLRVFPSLCRKTILSCGKVQEWALHASKAKCVHFIGRKVDYSAAVEGSLKWKEITYLPSEGYAAGELKHGTLALVDGDTPVIAILTNRDLAEKTLNAVHEVAARGAPVYLITCFSEFCNRDEGVESVLLPQTDEFFSPLVSVIPMQLLAYYASVVLGNDPDKPRNLAKSVTVE